MEVRAKVTSKGQVTVPVELRRRLGLQPGDTLVIREERGEYHLTKAPGPSRFAAWQGYLKDLAGQDPDEIVEDMRGR